MPLSVLTQYVGIAVKFGDKFCDSAQVTDFATKFTCDDLMTPIQQLFPMVNDVFPLLLHR
jgi:hypothetical protein